MLGSGTKGKSQSGAPRRLGIIGALLSIGRVGARFVVLVLLLWSLPAPAVVLWSDLGATLAHETGPGADILGGAVKRDDSSSDTLYFKFHVAPLSDSSTEEYFAAFELYAGDSERLGMGNALKAWAYSAFFSTLANGESNHVSYVDLRSAKPQPAAAAGASTYEFPLRGSERTIIFKVQYVPGGDDLITVWLDPDLGPGANEVYQPEALTTRFSADASFDEIRLRHGGGGGGWLFNDMAIATSFGDFVDTSSAKPDGAAPGSGPGGVAFDFQSWQRESGMPRGPIRALTQTTDGYLWLGSDGGVSRFDGVRFVAVDVWRKMPAAPVNVLLGASNGGLWVGTAGAGLIRYSGEHAEALTVRQGLPSDSITALAEDGQGRIWVGTDKGLVVFEKGTFQPSPSVAELRDKFITALVTDQAGLVWAGANGAGIYSCRAGNWEPLKEASANNALLLSPHSLLVDHAQRLWVAAGDDIVLCHDHDQWHRYRIPRHMARPYVTALAEEPDGTVWAGSLGEGLFQFKEGKLASINASSGLLNNLVKCLLVDRQGKLWVGTDAGLNRIRRKTLFRLGQEDGLGYGPVQGLAEVAPGEVWAAREGDGLFRWQGRTFSRLTAFGLPPRDSGVNTLLVSRDGSCWVASSKGLLRFKDPQAVADESVLSGLSALNVTALSEDQEGNIWAGTRAGDLWRLSRGSWTAQSSPWKPHAVSALEPGTENSMWVGTEGSGLYRLRADSPLRAERVNGLASEAVRALCSGGPDALWIGTAGQGLALLRHGNISLFTTSQGMPDNTVSQILEDGLGRLWLGGNRGITCLKECDLEDLAAGKINAVYPQFYGLAEGIPGDECATGFSPSGLRSRFGFLWFSTGNGVVAIDPRQMGSHTEQATIMLEDILVDGVPVPHSSFSVAASPRVKADAIPLRRLRIAPGKHRFEFQYTAIGFDDPERARFRYRLENLDSDWTDAGTRRTAFYNYVPPGDYHFRISACGADGVWHETDGGLALALTRHFWQTWWALGLAVAALVVATGGSMRLVEKRKLQRRLKRLEQERMLERERARIAQDLHDEMGAQLCRISFLSEHSRRDENLPADVRRQIGSISEASRDVLHSLDEIVWAVNPHNDTVEHAAAYIGQYAHEYFQRTGIECEVDMPAKLPSHPLSSQTRHHLFLAVREALANILKHSEATRSRVSVLCQPSAFEITAWDNGRGFDLSKARAKEGGAAATGDGLKNMNQRMSEIGGYCHAQSEQGKGTTIRFVVPLRHQGNGKDLL